MLREISAGIIVYRKTSQGLRYLLLYHGGRYWNFAKGHIEKEERSLEAAIRETQEETGLRRQDLKINNNFKAYEKFVFYKDKQKVFKTVIFYLAETVKIEIKISHEHEGYAWFSFKEASNMLGKHKDSVALLRRANNFITRGQNPRPNARQPFRSHSSTSTPQTANKIQPIK